MATRPGRPHGRRQRDRGTHRIALVRHGRRAARVRRGARAPRRPRSARAAPRSRAILPSVPVATPSAQASPARRSRCACQGSAGTDEIQPRAERLGDGRGRASRAPRACRRRRRTGARAPAVERRLEPCCDARERVEPSGRLQPERRSASPAAARCGRPSACRRAPRVSGGGLGGALRDRGRSMGTAVAKLQHERGVDDVLARGAPVHVARRLRRRSRPRAWSDGATSGIARLPACARLGRDRRRIVEARRAPPRGWRSTADRGITPTAASASASAASTSSIAWSRAPRRRPAARELGGVRHRRTPSRPAPGGRCRSGTGPRRSRLRDERRAPSARARAPGPGSSRVGGVVVEVHAGDQPREHAAREHADHEMRRLRARRQVRARGPASPS